MKTRIIKTHVWEDLSVREAPKDARILFLYLISNPRINMSGVYELSDKYILMETGLTGPELIKAKAWLQRENRAIFVNGWVKVVNAERHNNYNTSPKNKAEYAREKNKIPQHILTSFDTTIDTTIGTTMYSTRKSETVNHNIEREIESEERKRVGEIAELAPHQKTEDIVLKAATALTRPTSLTPHLVAHYLIELFRDLNPDVGRLHKIKHEADAALKLYQQVRGDLSRLENAIRILPEIAGDKYCPKEIKSINKPSLLLIHWALYGAQVRGRVQKFISSKPIVV